MLECVIWKLITYLELYATSAMPLNGGVGAAGGGGGGRGKVIDQH